MNVPPPPGPPQPPPPIVVAEPSETTDPKQPFIAAGMDSERIVFVETFDLPPD